MLKPAALLIAATTLIACATGGVGENTRVRTIGSDKPSPGIFSGKDGTFSGEFGTKTVESPAEAEQRAEATGTNDAEYQAWKKSREQEEYEAWKREQAAKK